MKNLKKFIVYVIIVVLSIVFFGPSNVFAQTANNCATCKSTPEAMQHYINFEVELLGALQEVNEETESLGDNLNVGLFAGGVLSLQKAFLKSTVQKVNKDLSSETKAVKASYITTVLLTKMNLEGFTNSFTFIDILFRDEAFVRDYKILQELDMSANDVVRDMGILGIRDSKVSPEIQIKILGLQQKYSQNDYGSMPIFKKLSISGSVRNKQLLTFILRINGLMKSTLTSAGDSSMVDVYVKAFNNKYSQGNIIAELNMDYIDAIISDYSCVKSSVCNETVKEAIDGLLDVAELKGSFGRSWNTIKDSWHNLVELRNPFKTYTNVVWDADNTGGLTERQVELLRTVYGIDSKDLTTSQIETRKRNWSNIEKQLNPFSSLLGSSEKISVLDGTINTDSKVKNEGNNQQIVWREKLSQEEKRKLENELYWQNVLPNSEDVQSLLDQLQNITNNLLVEKTKDKEILLVGLNMNTHYFIEIGSYIHSIVDGEISEALEELGDACTYQCGTNGTENCYASN